MLILAIISTILLSSAFTLRLNKYKTIDINYLVAIITIWVLYAN